MQQFKIQCQCSKCGFINECTIKLEALQVGTNWKCVECKFSLFLSWFEKEDEDE